MKTIMIKLFHLATLFCVLVAISSGCRGISNEELTRKWIAEAKKPIICKYAGSYWDGGSEWTLIDAEGNVYATGNVRMTLPDTIKTSNGN